MNTAMDFIQSLQEMKKARDQWAGFSVSERSEILSKTIQSIQHNKTEIQNILLQGEFFSADFINRNEMQASFDFWNQTLKLEPASGILPRPTGFISILLPELFSFRVLSERLVSALLAGNGVFVYFPESQNSQAEFWKKNLDSQIPARFFCGGEELEQILAAHPAIHAVSFYGSVERAQKLTPQFAQGNWKKWQVTSGFHNSALIMNEVDLPAVARSLAASCFQGMGQLHWNVSTIYVTESLREAFEKEFLPIVEKIPQSSVLPSTLSRSEKLIEQFKSEKGKILLGGEPGKPMIVEDLSHCSTLQQDCLAAPIVLVSPVKYVHEMVKWSNTSYYGMYAQIFGAQEKVEKFAPQLDVSRVGANSWIETMRTLPTGMKQSFFGISSLHPFGEFYSDLRKIDA